MIIAVTSRTPTREVDDARTAGCDAVIGMPFDSTALAMLPRVLTHGVAALDVPGGHFSLNGDRAAAAMS